jgi:pyridoxal phosphate enzyme (YggS family)
VEIDLEARRQAVRQRHADVLDRVAAAAERAERDPAEVTLVAVTKAFGAWTVVAAAAVGITVVGENRVQEARDKRPEAETALAREPGLSHPSWHLVGHLQRNKVRVALDLFDWIESVDSLSLARELSQRLEAAGRTMPILIEVKTAPEETKRGIPPDQASEIVPEIAGLPGLDLRGLMTVAPLGAPARPAFRLLASLRAKLADQLQTPLPHLSMGMSGDFEEAVEEGATLIRLGTALFGPRRG